MRYYEILERQLVRASGRLSDSAEARRVGPKSQSGWARRSRRGVAIVVAFTALSGSAIAAVVATSPGGDEGPAINAIRKLQSVSGAHPMVQAWGLDPNAAKPAFDSGLGLVSIVQNDAAACLVISNGQDLCYSAAAISTGLAFSIHNDCSVGSDRSMTIEGFVPPGASRVAVTYSNGSAPLHSEAVNGGYILSGSTPPKGKPYPTSLRYLNGNGVQVSAREIPDGDDLCLTRAPAAPTNTP